MRRESGLLGLHKLRCREKISSMQHSLYDINRYDRLCLVFAPAFIVSQYLLFLLMHYVIRWRPRLTADAIKAATGSKGATDMTEAAWRSFSIEAAQLVWSGFFHIIYGAAALATVYHYDHPEPWAALGDRGVLLASGNVDAIMLQEAAAFLGSIFGALMISYTFYWVIGWDRGLEQIFHHVTFFSVTIVLARRSALPYSGLWAMAMEASSPALNAMNLLRQLDGWLPQQIALVAFALFIVAFFALRCVLFGRTVLHTWYLRLFAPDGFPLHVPAWETDLVVLLWLAGWLLQLYWMRAIVLKVRRKLRGAPPPRAPAQDDACKEH